MNDILFQYHKVHPTTWIYLSSLMTIGLYFKFSRLWSVRNLDLIGLILLSPGLLMVGYGVESSARMIEQGGYVWLFVVGVLFMIRLLLDPMMVRRPLLEPNLSVGGMTFIGISLLLFLMANVINSPVDDDEVAPHSGQAEGSAAPGDAPMKPRMRMHLPPLVAHLLLLGRESDDPGQHSALSRDIVYQGTVRTMAILSHVAVVIGMVVIGYQHFDNIRTGIAAAMLYLMMPYTAQMTGRVDHVLTAALLIWAVAMYRRPIVSGMFIGLSIGLIYYPVFLLPLWIGFYWQRGLLRFLSGVATTAVVVVIIVALSSDSMVDYWRQSQRMLGWSATRTETIEGFWSFDFLDPAYRIPVVAAFLALCGSLALWPAQKNLGTLMSCSAAVMLGTQFWHANGGGLYVAWYLPLMLLTIFRPNLEDRIALAVLPENWFPRRKTVLRVQAA